MEPVKLLHELPTVKNSNTKQELALLKNILYNEDDKIPDDRNANQQNDLCNRSKLQDFWLVLIAMTLFLILGNPWTLKIFNLLSDNLFVAFIFTLLVFGASLYIIYIFMP